MCAASLLSVGGFPGLLTQIRESVMWWCVSLISFLFIFLFKWIVSFRAIWACSCWISHASIIAMLFCPDWNISPTTGLIAMIFSPNIHGPQRINPANSTDLTCPLIRTSPWGFDLQWWINVTCLVQGINANANASCGFLTSATSRSKFPLILWNISTWWTNRHIYGSQMMHPNWWSPVFVP